MEISKNLVFLFHSFSIFIHRSFKWCIMGRTKTLQFGHHNIDSPVNIVCSGHIFNMKDYHQSDQPTNGI
jgi:hypothetical protein